MSGCFTTSAIWNAARWVVFIFSRTSVSSRWQKAKQPRPLKRPEKPSSAVSLSNSITIAGQKKAAPPAAVTAVGIKAPPAVVTKAVAVAATEAHHGVMIVGTAPEDPAATKVEDTKAGAVVAMTNPEVAVVTEVEGGGNPPTATAMIAAEEIVDLIRDSFFTD